MTMQQLFAELNKADREDITINETDLDFHTINQDVSWDEDGVLLFNKAYKRPQLRLIIGGGEAPVTDIRPVFTLIQGGKQ